MITLEQAYDIVTSNLPPNRYIARINECVDLYEFIDLKIGERLEDIDDAPFTYPVVYKKDGRFEKNVDLWTDDFLDKYIRSYDESEIKEMMKRAS